MQSDDYSVEDLIENEFFRQWVLQPTAAAGEYWQHWIRQSPDRQAAAQEASRIILSLDFTKLLLSDEKQAMWQHIQAATAEPKPVFAEVFRQPLPIAARRRQYWSIAAVVTLLLAGFLAYWLWQLNGPQAVETRFGEIRKVTLADGSSVTLNANSRLRYPGNFPGQAVREVWVEGEAFFSVQKVEKEGHRVPFVVHAGKLKVEVLGTAFNVNTRRGKVNVVLQHGSVLITDPQKRQILLKPGEMLAETTAASAWQKKPVRTEEYTCWQRGEIPFRQKSLAAIGQQVEDTYGVKVVIENRALLNETFTATLSRDSLDAFFEKLQKLYPLEVRKENDTYYIK